MKITVIIPVYNVELYLRKCVLSVINQTYKNLEIILIDDGSTDESAKICDDLKKDDNRVIVYHKQNGGLSSARNCGIKLATGEFITFIDSDDFVHPMFIEVLVEGIKKYNTKMSMCRFLKISSKDNLSFEKVTPDWDIKKSKDLLIDLYTDNNEQTVVTVNKMYEKNLFETDNFPLGKIHEDEFYIPELISKVEEIAVTNTQLYYYLIREGSITQRKWNKKKFDYLEALEKRLNLAESLNYNEFYNLTIYRYCLTLARFIYELRKLKDYEEIKCLKLKFQENLKRCKFNDFVLLNKLKLICEMYSKVIARILGKVIRILEK